MQAGKELKELLAKKGGRKRVDVRGIRVKVGSRRGSSRRGSPRRGSRRGGR